MVDMASGTLTEQLQTDDYGNDEGRKQDDFPTSTTAVAEPFKEDAGVEIAVSCDTAACEIPGAELVGVAGHRPEEHEMMETRDEDHGAVEAQHASAEAHHEAAEAHHEAAEAHHGAAEAHHLADESHHQVTADADQGGTTPQHAGGEPHDEVTEAHPGDAEPHHGSTELQHGATEADHGTNDAHPGVDPEQHHHAATDAHHGVLEAHHATEEAQPVSRMEDESGAVPREDMDRNTGLAPPAGEEMGEDPGAAIGRTSGGVEARDASPAAHGGGSPHTEAEKEHKCPVEGCDKSYSLRKSYVDHIRKRHGLLSKDISGLSRDETIPITSTRPVGPRPRNPDDPIVEFRCQFPDCGRVYTLRKSWVDHARKRHNLHSKDLPPNYAGEVVVPGSARAAEHLAALGAGDATATEQHLQGGPGMSMVVGVPGGHTVTTPSAGDANMQSGAAFEEGTSVWQYLKKWAELSGSTMDDGEIVMSEVEREAAIQEMQKQGKSVEIVEALQGALAELAKATAAESGPANLAAAAETHEILKAIKDAVESGRRFSPALLASVEKLHLGMKSAPPPSPVPGMAGSFTASLRGDGAMVLSQPPPLALHQVQVHSGQMPVQVHAGQMPVTVHHPGQVQVHDPSVQLHHLHSDNGGQLPLGHMGVGVDAVPVHPGSLAGPLPDSAHVPLGGDLPGSLGAMLSAAAAAGAAMVGASQGLPPVGAPPGVGVSGSVVGPHSLVLAQGGMVAQPQLPQGVASSMGSLPDLHAHAHHHHHHDHGGMLADGVGGGGGMDHVQGHHLQGVPMHLQGGGMLGGSVGVPGGGSHHLQGGEMDAHAGHLAHVMAASPPGQHVQGPSPPQDLLEGHVHHHAEGQEMQQHHLQPAQQQQAHTLQLDLHHHHHHHHHQQQGVSAHHLAPHVVTAADVVPRAPQGSLRMHGEPSLSLSLGCHEGGLQGHHDAVGVKSVVHLHGSDGAKEMQHGGGMGEEMHGGVEGHAHVGGVTLGEVHERPEDAEGLEPSAKRHCP